MNEAWWCALVFTITMISVWLVFLLPEYTNNAGVTYEMIEDLHPQTNQITVILIAFVFVPLALLYFFIRVGWFDETL